MGDPIDKPMTEWEESFVPMEFRRRREDHAIGADG
jgi:hypothetical protein